MAGCGQLGNLSLRQMKDEGERMKAGGRKKQSITEFHPFAFILHPLLHPLNCAGEFYR